MNDLFGRVVLDRGFPIPEGRVHRKRIEWDGLREKLPFQSMALGDSFAVWAEDYGCSMIVLQNYISGAAAMMEKEYCSLVAFTTRQMPDGSVRCWRIEPKDQKGRGE